MDWMTNRQLRIFLGIQEDDHIKSTLILALRNARRFSGRDMSTGIQTGFAHITDEDIFAAITHFLIVLDILGCSIKNQVQCNCSNGIKRCLKMFSSLNKADINAMKSLRNTVAHNYGLATEAPKKNNDPRYKFHISVLQQELFVHSKREFGSGFGKDDIYHDKSSDSDTVVGFEPLCNLVEQVYRNVISAYYRDEIELNNMSDYWELQSRFLITVY